jgi:hypothetical protein
VNAGSQLDLNRIGVPAYCGAEVLNGGGAEFAILFRFIWFAFMI